jgi:hypothetical protein
MSTHDPDLLPASPRRLPRSSGNAHLLARSVQCRRLGLKMTAEHAAKLAGLAISQWYALECGWVPEEQSTLLAIAAVLETSLPDLETLATLSRSSWSGYS